MRIGVRCACLLVIRPVSTLRFKSWLLTTLMAWLILSPPCCATILASLRSFDRKFVIRWHKCEMQPSFVQLKPKPLPPRRSYTPCPWSGVPWLVTWECGYSVLLDSRSRQLVLTRPLPSDPHIEPKVIPRPQGQWSMVICIYYAGAVQQFPSILLFIYLSVTLMNQQNSL